jgi:hypothetical protein
MAGIEVPMLKYIVITALLWLLGSLLYKLLAHTISKF